APRLPVRVRALRCRSRVLGPAPVLARYLGRRPVRVPVRRLPGDRAPLFPSRGRVARVRVTIRSLLPPAAWASARRVPVDVMAPSGPVATVLLAIPAVTARFRVRPRLAPALRAPASPVRVPAWAVRVPAPVARVRGVRVPTR